MLNSPQSREPSFRERHPFVLRVDGIERRFTSFAAAMHGVDQDKAEVWHEKAGTLVRLDPHTGMVV